MRKCGFSTTTLANNSECLAPADSQRYMLNGVHLGTAANGKLFG